MSRLDELRRRGWTGTGLNPTTLAAALAPDWTATRDARQAVTTYRHADGRHFVVDDLMMPEPPEAVGLMVAALHADRSPPGRLLMFTSSMATVDGGGTTLSVWVGPADIGGT